MARESERTAREGRERASGGDWQERAGKMSAVGERERAGESVGERDNDGGEIERTDSTSLREFRPGDVGLSLEDYEEI
ncbi:hypothetical protein PanWU01x14_130320 [Parasponia andersonii]|uniref:Uncharacterized protein n=1 Tax=Parasponia andersonii TaxID=3476 RepID=A0A2P5CR71_PARAD|nr:hypothetical protein PanWU01x14_130320 [Parasponia andersonii]